VKYYNYFTEDGKWELRPYAEKTDKMKYDWTIFNRRFIIREIDLRSVHMPEDKCFCGSGKFYAECHSEVKENTAMAYLFRAFKLIDEDIKQARPTPMCSKKCTKCCWAAPEVSALEFFAIVKHIQTRKTERAFTSLKDWIRVAQNQRPMFPTFAAFDEISGKRLTVPCIFLDNREEKCRIYEVRPLLCRLYGYYSNFGKCLDVENEITFVKPVVDEIGSTILGGIPTDKGIIPPVAAPLVYWLGGEPVFENQDVKDLFLVAHNQNILEYIRFSINLDFNEWFRF